MILSCFAWPLKAQNSQNLKSTIIGAWVVQNPKIVFCYEAFLFYGDGQYRHDIIRLEGQKQFEHIGHWKLENGHLIMNGQISRNYRVTIQNHNRLNFLADGTLMMMGRLSTESDNFLKNAETCLRLYGQFGTLENGFPAPTSPGIPPGNYQVGPLPSFTPGATTTTPTYRNCGACYGTGTCQVCLGTGRCSSYGQASSVCSNCGGTGRCPNCGGTGKMPN